MVRLALQGQEMVSSLLHTDLGNRIQEYCTDCIGMADADFVMGDPDKRA
jgi:hypothetical protein